MTTATPVEFITELCQAVNAVIAPSECFYGHAPQKLRQTHVVITTDLVNIDPEMEHANAHVANRVSFDCKSYTRGIEAAELADVIHRHFREFQGELVPGGNVRIELAEREGLASAPLYEGDQTHWLEILSYLFIYRED